jgi:hypothetical protein
VIDSKVDYSITLNETNVIKGIAICAMLWHHLFLESHEYGEVIFKLASTCKVCVALFVFLSGYGMAVQFGKVNLNGKFSTCVDVVKFLARRYFKFYLNYWIVFFISVPIGIFVFDRSLKTAYGSDLLVCFLRDVFGFQVYNSYNITWWFNSLILVLWVFFPILYWALKNKFVCVWVLVLILFNPGGILSPLGLLAEFLLQYLVVFAFGICAAVHIDVINKVLNRVNGYVFLVASLIITILLLYMRNHYVLYCFWGMGGDPFIASFLSFAVVSICRLCKTRMSVMAYLGKHSMNMYLTHTFIFGYFFRDFIYSFKYPILIFIALLLSSLLLSIVIEFFKRKIRFYKLQQKVCLFFE